MVKHRDIEEIKKVSIPKLPASNKQEVLYNRAGITLEERVQAIWETLARGDDTKLKALDERMREIENGS